MNFGDDRKLAGQEGVIRTRGIAIEDRRIRFVLNMLQSRSILTAPHGRRSRRLQCAPHRFQLCRPIATVAAPCAWGVAFVRLSTNCYDELPTHPSVSD